MIVITDHKSGYLPCLFRFNTTLVRRVQPIYHRVEALSGCTSFSCNQKIHSVYMRIYPLRLVLLCLINLLYSFNLIG